MKKYKRNSKYLALVVFLLLIGVGYAVLNANLTINGSSSIANANWDVHFENPNPTGNSNVTPSVAPAADPNDKVQSISYTVTFNEPGDVYEFTVDVANRGSIDAMIDSITSTYKIGEASPVNLLTNDPPEYINYYVTYSDDNPIAVKQQLLHDTVETLLVHVEFKRNITNNQFEGAVGNSITFTYGLNYVQTDGTEINAKPPVCVPATVLHSKECTAESTGCYAAGFTGANNEITYGTTVNGTPKAGDAYDCKVTKTGGYSERFYYVGSSGDNSILIYYKNINDQTTYAYDSSNENWHGPRTVYEQLPSTSTWNNSGLIAPGTRSIKAEDGNGTTTGGTIESFAYTGKAARLLTTQELVSACGNTTMTDAGYLDNCNWLLENLGQYETESGAYGYWLETPSSISANSSWGINGKNRKLDNYESNTMMSRGVRPVITIKTANLGN